MILSDRSVSIIITITEMAMVVANWGSVSMIYEEIPW